MPSSDLTGEDLVARLVQARRILRTLEAEIIERLEDSKDTLEAVRFIVRKRSVPRFDYRPLLRVLKKLNIEDIPPLVTEWDEPALKKAAARKRAMDDINRARNHIGWELIVREQNDE